MTTFRIKGTEDFASCTPRKDPVGFFDGKKWVTEFWVDDEKVFTLEKEKGEPVFVPARAY